MTEPIFVNPNSYDNITVIMDKLKKHFRLEMNDNGLLLVPMARPMLLLIV